MAEKIQLTKKDRLSVAWRHQFLQGSWNYERMPNLGFFFFQAEDGIRDVRT